MSARVLRCAHCGAPTSFLAASCAYCRAPLTWHDVPTLRRGPLIRGFDLRAGELMPGMDHVIGLVHVPGRGVVVPIEAMRQLFLVSGVQRADVAVRVEASALEPGVGLGIELRVTKLGHARTSYAVKVLPWRRAFRVVRLLSTKARPDMGRAFAREARFGEGARRSRAGGVFQDPSETERQLFVDTLREIETVPQLGGVGERIELEARCADSILSFHAGEHHLGSLVDARYGFGGFGLSVSGYHAAGHVLVESFALHEVA